MTENEYTLEMLCCLPKELLSSRLNKPEAVQQWLQKITNEVIEDAIAVYDTPQYAEIRENMLSCL